MIAIQSPAHAVVPTGFSDDVLAAGFDVPVAAEFDATGRLFVAEKRGIVWLVDNSVALPTPVIDLVDEVHDAHDKGLLGLALDPDFATNGYLYLLYQVDPVFGQPDDHPESATVGRLTRFTVVGDTASPASRLELVGATPGDGFANCYRSHAIGTVKFGTDGSLFVGAGDGAHYDFTDGGEDQTPFDPECATMFGAAQDIGALRSQDGASLAGKILRIDPATGLGYPDNPFWDGDPASFASRIWSGGWRNPYRFTVRPGSPPPGTLYVGDVGHGQWEELDVSYGGENYGWPCFEGPDLVWEYHNDTITGPFCQGLPQSATASALLSWHHTDPGSLGFIGNTVSGVVFYDGASFPTPYHDRCFIADYGDNWIKVVTVDASDQLLAVEDFANSLSLPVDLDVDPLTGDLVYVSIAEQTVRRIRWIAGNVPPVVVAAANPTTGTTPLDVQFSSDGTFDPNGDSFALTWDFGDGSPVSPAPNPMHTYTDVGQFTVWLHAVDDSGAVDSASVVVETINQAPSVDITSPVEDYVFVDDEVIDLVANASDPEDGTNLAWSWVVDLIHNDHPHVGYFVSSDSSTSFVASAHGEDGDRYSYRIRVSVTDTGGAAASDTTWIFPESQGPNQPPIPAFETDVTFGAAPLVVLFDAGPTVDPDDDLLFYDWDFGDGTIGSGISTTHIYGEPDLYTVTLTARDAVLAVSTTGTILVEPGGAILHWRFDEATGMTAADASGSGHDGAVDGATWVTGMHGNALEFDGVDDAVTSGQPLLDSRPTFSMAAWIRPASTASRIGIVGQNDAIELGFITANLVQAWTPGGGNVTTAWPYGMNQWHHIAVVGTGAEIQLYFDGSLVGMEAVVTSSYGSSSYGVNVGGAGIFDEEGNNFHGRIDDVRIYADPLAPADIALLAAVPPANAAPTVDAGADGIASWGEAFPLLGVVSDDGLPSPPGQVSVTWAQVSGPATASIFAPTTLFTLVSFPTPGDYRFELTADDSQATATDSLTVSVPDPTSATPAAISIAPGIQTVAPNPSRSFFNVTFAVPKEGTAAEVSVVAIDGRRVTVLVDGAQRSGVRSVRWGGRDRRGERVASGVYFVIAEIGGHRSARKVTVLR